MNVYIMENFDWVLVAELASGNMALEMYYYWVQRGNIAKLEHNGKTLKTNYTLLM